jgi:uncharacterized protein (DUF58 family)
MASGELFDDEFLRRLQRLGLIAKRMPAPSAASGQRRSQRLGDGLEFADHRQYSPGDDIRFLDWNYYARMERLLLRLFHMHSEGAVTILLDASASMALGNPPKFDYARRAAAALAYVAMISLDRVNILPFGQALQAGLATGRNAGKILQVLEYLRPLQAQGPTALGAVLDQLLRRHPQSGTVLLLSDLLEVEDELSAGLALLRRRRDEVIVLHVIDPGEAQPPAAGAVQLEAAESRRRMEINLTPELVDNYRQRFQRFAHGVEKTCLARGAIYLPAHTEMEFDRLVLLTLQKAGLLQQ